MTVTPSADRNFAGFSGPNAAGRTVVAAGAISRGSAGPGPHVAVEMIAAMVVESAMSAQSLARRRVAGAGRIDVVV